MKKILTILCCAVLKISFAQNSLTGRVTAAEDLSEVIGASVYIPDLKRGAVTDKDGIYSITNLPKGKFLIECKIQSIGSPQGHSSSE